MKEEEEEESLFIANAVKEEEEGLFKANAVIGEDSKQEEGEVVDVHVEDEGGRGMCGSRR